ncbi:hypothetical protein [Intrasporangium sp.]|uniref:hypothetical protein n=1 Tax=Intrasporangium sp. TaxID=1925024 RepID=UPI003221668C
MDQIEPEALYEERGETSRARPLLQGDVFEKVVLPGFGDEPQMVQIVTHPCGMRTGPDLTPRITVAPVVPHQVVAGSGWNGSLRVMPLVELIGSDSFATKFVDVTAAPAELLTRERRIATLTHKGIYVLQQRLIKHYTRVEMPLELLRRQSVAVLTEAELQWHWIEEVLTPSELEDNEAIDAEAKIFDDWLGQGDPSRRALLRDEINHATVRKQTHESARQRAATRGE